MFWFSSVLDFRMVGWFSRIPEFSPNCPWYKSVFQRNNIIVGFVTSAPLHWHSGFFTGIGFFFFGPFGFSQVLNLFPIIYVVRELRVGKGKEFFLDIQYQPFRTIPREDQYRDRSCRTKLSMARRTRPAELAWWLLTSMEKISNLLVRVYT